MVICKAFDSASFVQQLMSYFSLEEEKGKDKFHFQKYTLFKVHKVNLSSTRFINKFCSIYLGIMVLGSYNTLDLIWKRWHWILM